MAKVYKYYAFISYKHADEKWAKWLQRQLETYRLPVALQKQNCPKRVKPIFRDNTDLTPGNLESKLRENLELSQHLIVICSRNLAKESHYIDFEMQTFLDMGRQDKIIPFIVDGEPNSPDPENECFSEFIKQFPGELLAANVQKDGKHIATLKIIAAILHLDADDLIRRDRKRIWRNRFLAAVTAVAALFCLTAFLNLTAQNYEKEAQNSYFYTDTENAVKNAVRSLQVPFHKDPTNQAAVILRNAVLSNELRQSNSQFHKDYETRSLNKNVYLFAESTDKTKVGFSDYSRVYAYEAQTGKYLRSFNGSMNPSEEEKAEFESYFGVSYDQCYHSVTNNSSFQKKDPIHHVQTVRTLESQDVLVIQDRSSTLEKWFLIDKDSATWTYTEQEDLIAVYAAEADPSITVYSFPHDVTIQLDCPERYSGVSGLYFSPKGRYLFVNFYEKTPDGFYGAHSLCVYDLESRGLLLEQQEDESSRSVLGQWCFSQAENRQAIYLFSSYRIERYSFTDREPILVNNVLWQSESGTVLCERNPRLDSIHFSDDGTKAVSIHTVSDSSSGFYTQKILYTFFDIHTGEKLTSIVFDSFDNFIDITPDIRYVLYYLDGSLYLYDIDTDSILLNRSCQDDAMSSVAISRDGKHAAYITELGELTVLRNLDGSLQVQTCTVTPSGQYTSILFVNDTECYVNSGNEILAYRMDTGEIRLVQQDVWECRNTVQLHGNNFDMFKSLKDLNDLGVFLYSEDIAGLYTFYDKTDGRISICGDSVLLNANYSPESRLLVGTEYTNQVQYNNELVVIRFDGSNSEVLYRYITNVEIDELYFDNTGKYLIINGYGDEGCEVLDAQTGTLLFALDRSIRIHDDVVYDISQDLVLPDKLPCAQMGSIDTFIQRGTALLKQAQ